ncbi:dixin-like isoform X1 [Periophthalmus magnuspinnatus]|uniref:dixin-like isoform X1 n=1 Tax=Periophthalmus magnuspinnatus TaxID=409849 RepID=UPI0024373E66|nr:dixin-like isoform X1 [Periophthalmus magnuspinnatus]
MIASLSRGSLLDDVLHGGFNEQQLVTYVSWVNTQLKRKPGLSTISDLRHDLQDGVVLTQLIEIVAGEVLEGVHPVPQNKDESRKNVEKVLQFISSRHIRMPHISAKDIVEGNLKSIMRIILALAAHFKPSAYHRATSISGRSVNRASTNHNPLSTVALAQRAAAALASARIDASQPPRTTRLHSSWDSEEKSVSVRALVKQYERKNPNEPDDDTSNSLGSTSPLSSPRTGPSIQFERIQNEQQQQTSESTVAMVTSWEDSISDDLEKEVLETRKMVSALQNLLLHGSLPEDDQDMSLKLDQCNDEQQLTVLRSRLDQSMEEAKELKREVLRCKQEIRNLQGVKEAQQQRLCSQETSILQMKQELLRASMTRDELNNQNRELQWKVEESNRLWGECKKEIVQKDRLLQQLKHKLEESQKHQCELQRELEHKNAMLQELRNRDLQQITTDNNGFFNPGSPTSPVTYPTEEVQLLRDSLRSLRNNFHDHDPQQHTLDTLEQGIVSLMDRLHVLHPHRGRGKSPRRKEINQPQVSSSASTKFLYFAGKSPTPSMIHIPKRLGEVTLKDVKAAVDREGNYRYHFKALDPEFGTVKEEVFLDGAIVPGWEGKIVAWLEEDGQERPV